MEGVEKPIVNHGLITVPDKPGLGVTLNEDVVKAHLLPGTGYFAPTTRVGPLKVPPTACGVRLIPMPAKPKYIAGLVQMSCSPNPGREPAKSRGFVEDAARRGAEVVCLPELFRSQYFCQREDVALFDLAETVPGPTTETLGKVAKARGVVIVAPLFERRAPGVYHNSAAVIDASGEVVGLYRKMHIPDDPAYYEKFYFTPGDLGFRAFNTQVGRIADADLLGPVVSGGRAPGGPARAQHSLLPHGHRLASGGEGAIRRRAA